MEHLSIATLGVLLAVSASPRAQAPTPTNTPPASRPQTPAQTTQRPDRDVDDDVMVTGCLRLWDPSIGALPGEPSTGPRYVLTDARQDEKPGKDVVVLRRYVVTGDPTVNLAGHIDKTVRVSGNVMPLAAALKLPAPGAILPRPDAPVRPGEATRPGEIPPPISEKAPHPDPAWLTLSASAIEVTGGTCTPTR